MDVGTYSEPVNKLLTYDEPEATRLHKWPDYLALGITQEHIPDLLRMIADPSLRTVDDDEDPKYWAAVHAWRALGQLRTPTIIEPLLRQTPELLDHDSGVNEWAIEELPDVYALIGPSAIPIIAEYLADQTHHKSTLVNLTTSLVKIGEAHSEAKEECVATLTHQLEAFSTNHPIVNSFIINALSDLKATETLPLIEQVFASKRIDSFTIGLDDVLVKFGLKEREERSFPNFFAPPQSLEKHASEVETPISRVNPSDTYWRTSTGPTKENKQKNKEKMAKASRNKNKKRR